MAKTELDGKMGLTKSGKMALTQVVELLRQGNIEALVNVPQSLVIQATAELGKANRSRGLEAVVYGEGSGAIGIKGVRSRPVVLYKGEWEIVREYIQTEAFGKAMDDPIASTGSDDPRYATYRAAAKEKAKAEREARK